MLYVNTSSCNRVECVVLISVLSLVCNISDLRVYMCVCFFASLHKTRSTRILSVERLAACVNRNVGARAYTNDAHSRTCIYSVVPTTTSTPTTRSSNVLGDADVGLHVCLCNSYVREFRVSVEHTRIYTDRHLIVILQSTHISSSISATSRELLLGCSAASASQNRANRN